MRRNPNRARGIESGRLVDYSESKPPMANHRNELTDISGEIRGETELAWRFFDGKTTEWIPKSQCEWDEETSTMTMPYWLAEEKGFI